MLLKMIDVEKLISNFQNVRDSIADAARASGRSDNEIELIAVSKTVSIDTIITAYETCGQSLFGENRADILREKVEILSERGLSGDISFDYIGKLQTNKVKWVVGNARIIHSVDSLRLLEAIAERAERENLVQAVLLQVDIAGEAQKSGLQKDEVSRAINYALAQDSIALKGLMCMAPNLPPHEIDWVFESLRKTRDLYVSQYQNEGNETLQLDMLSMGMSNDYEAAILHGSTVVRIGSALFNQVELTRRNNGNLR